MPHSLFNTRLQHIYLHCRLVCGQRLIANWRCLGMLRRASLLGRTLLLGGSLLVVIHPAFALEIASNPLNANQRETIQTLVAAFRQQHPELKVVLAAQEHEAYKKQIEQRLKAADADIFFWFGGRRLRQFAQRGLILNLESLWQRNQWSESFTKGAKTAVSFAGESYGLPLYYYQWGIYYRSSVFSKAGLTPPRTWPELEQVAATLLQKGITPFTLGSNDHWPVAGWFDYLNLRLNGMAFHLELLTGQASFLDARVTRVFTLWQGMLDKGYFIGTHADNDWRGALPYLYHERAAMMLMGNFFLSTVPDNLRRDFSFFPFPEISPEVAQFEEAPVDILMVSAKTRKLEEVEKFLQFVAQPENQSVMARAMEMIPTNQFSDAGANENILLGAELLKRAEGVTQFFDRDSNAEFAEPAMAVLAKFVSGHLDINKTQQALDGLAKQYLVE